MKPFHAFLLAVAALSLFACGKKEPELAPLGDAAPAISQGGDLATFVIGRWNLLAPGESVSVTRFYEFKPGGKFTTTKTDAGWLAEGTWTVRDNRVDLEYQTMNGKSLMAFKEQIQKESEGGGQASLYRAEMYDALYSQFNAMRSLWVDEDMKHLTFSDPATMKSLGNMQMGEMSVNMDQLMKQSAIKLERMGLKKG